MVNPYESSQLDRDDHAVIAGRVASPHFTHITVNGCNLMGLLNFFAFIGVLALVVPVILPLSRMLGVIVLVSAVCGCPAIDFTRRIRCARGELWMRLLSPHAGGSLFFIPVWAVYPAMAVTGFAILLSKN
jgi:hypothetical protein